MGGWATLGSGQSGLDVAHGKRGHAFITGAPVLIVGNVCAGPKKYVTRAPATGHCACVHLVDLEYYFKIFTKILVKNVNKNGLPKTGEKHAITPFINVNFTISESAKCIGSQVQYLQLLDFSLPFDVTCNGYFSMDTVWNEYEIVVDGDMNEVNHGVVTGGRCAGDTFFMSMAYVADDQEGCAGGKGVSSLTLRAFEARLTGPTGY
ncbi:unnamed protein product [Medioppia subpectinata]|uniref:Uncharacterized protein n=1 Tax=Medioppia subpectinata TaxID=1979941 RepID=A0A7R9KZT9_9ACAR|nr:unnamed protein product [Medioppia subpectinata]CAG2111735.1 unnamed protein product [Medioppia subpectinata]